MMLRRSDKTPFPRQLPSSPRAHAYAWPRRLLLGSFAVAGTAVYAVSFRTLPGAAVAPLAAAAAALGIAAATAWLAFGAALLLLLLLTRARPSALAWADACLAAMARGTVLLVCGAALNLAIAASGVNASTGALLAAHLALLLTGNVVMATVFVRRARPLGLAPAAAVSAWAGALDAPFLLILMSLYRSGVFV